MYFHFCLCSTRIREDNFPGSSLLEAKAAVFNLGVERDRTLNSSEDLQAFLLHSTCWFWPALSGKTNSYRGSHPENRCCVASCSRQAWDMFIVFEANKPLLTPHLGSSSKTAICATPSCLSRGGTLGISQGSDISDASPPFFCSTAQFWQWDALLVKHDTQALSTVSAWGEMRKPFPPGSKSTNKFWLC